MLLHGAFFDGPAACGCKMLQDYRSETPFEDLKFASQGLYLAAASLNWASNCPRMFLRSKLFSFLQRQVA